MFGKHKTLEKEAKFSFSFPRLWEAQLQTPTNPSGYLNWQHPAQDNAQNCLANLAQLLPNQGMGWGSRKQLPNCTNNLDKAKGKWIAGHVFLLIAHSCFHHAFGLRMMDRRTTICQLIPEYNLQPGPILEDPGLLTNHDTALISPLPPHFIKTWSGFHQISLQGKNRERQRN